MTAFEIAIKSLFNDGNITIDAVFIPRVGQTSIVRVITRAPDIYQNIGQSSIAAPTLTLEVFIADCPVLSQDDQFLINSITYKIQGEPRRDAGHLIWWIDVYKT